MVVTWKSTVLLFAVAAGALLLLTLPTFGPFDAQRVGSAGEWFAGVGAAAVLAWAVGEPQRQRRRDAEENTRQRRVAAAERAVRAIVASNIRPGEDWSSNDARQLYEQLEVERQAIDESPLSDRMNAVLVYLMASWNEGARRRAELDSAVVKGKTAQAVEACNRQLLAAWREDALPVWGWPAGDPTPLPANSDDAWADLNGNWQPYQGTGRRP